MARNVADMVSGLGMALRFITLLIDAIKKKGGCEAMLHFLTADAGQANLEVVADLIVSQKWKAAKSVVMDMARRESLKDFGAGHEDVDRDFFWRLALDKLGIPFLSFVLENEVSADTLSVSKLRGELQGKSLAIAMPVRWEGNQYYLSGIGFDGREPEAGEIINLGDVTYVHLVSVEFIDLDR